jgi:hypothetical protein
MEQLFSCRNCIHNASQSIHIGNGQGFCLKHDSIIRDPAQTTCKYLHRKDLPNFVVDEGIREHAAEFANRSALVNLSTKQTIERVPYSERYVWERRAFDPTIHALAQYSKSNPGWVFVQSFAAGIDGRRALTHSGLVRRYMDRCGHWKSSYRLVLGLVQEIDKEPVFDNESIVNEGTPTVETHEQARWDVIFAKLSAVQEYGFHAGLENIMWVTDTLNGGLSELDWSRLQPELAQQRSQLINQIIEHATEQHVFFPPPEEQPREEPSY